MTEEQKNTAEQPEAQAGAASDPEVVVDEAAEAPDALRARIAQLEKEVADYKDQWLRSAADFKNYKRRIEQDRADLIRSASAGLLLKLLPVADDLERAVASIPAEIGDSPWFGGFKLIPQKLSAILESEGVTSIEALGQTFDPNQHEAVIYEEASDARSGTVTAELQRGYKLHDRVLRPTMVKVG